MKTLIWKELRENLKVALLGLALLTFILVENYRDAAGMYAELAKGQGNWNIASAEPLLSGSVTTSVGFIAALLGAVLGWLQIHNERHRDLWAFLVHRPLSRSKIFAAKATAGLALYTAAAGLPVLGFIGMVWMPGHIAAPFEWAMVLPILAFFLSGYVYYFAGMLTSLRQARWYASRGLGLGAALVVSLGLSNAPEFGRVLVFLLAGTAILGTAAWGSFLSNGCYAGQPSLGRRALAGALTVGALVIVGLALALLTSAGPQSADDWSRYQVTRDGRVYEMAQHVGEPLEIKELNGAPLLDPKTGHPITPANFNHLLAQQRGVQPSFDRPGTPPRREGGGFQQTGHYVSLGWQTSDTLWYLTWDRQLLGYDITSRRFIGSMGPGGFTPGKATGTTRFSRSPEQVWNDEYNPAATEQTFQTRDAVYAIDFEHRTARRLFQAQTNDPVGAALDISLGESKWDYTFVVTRNQVYLLTPDGKIVWQVPNHPGLPEYCSLAISFLEPSNHFVLSFHANQPLEATNLLPSHYVWIAAGQGAITNCDLPTKHMTHTIGWTQKTIAVALPPAFFPAFGWLYGNGAWRLIGALQSARWMGLLLGAACAGAGWWLGRRGRFSVGAQLKWFIFHLITGLPGLLGFLAVQEWPAREPCPDCKRPRLVDREECEYCGAGFAPPARNGTEIFES